MKVMLVASVATMILPLTVGIEVFGAGIYFAWGCVSLYAALLAFAFWRRYRRGLWRSVEVIESAADAA
jgi:MATE family multidrug resistance protein